MIKTIVKEITCPQCERIWPTISEQGIVCELYSKCYQCLIEQVVEVRNERAEAADYTVQACRVCGGLPTEVAACFACGGKGWYSSDRKQVVPLPRSKYHH